MLALLPCVAPVTGASKTIGIASPILGAVAHIGGNILTRGVRQIIDATDSLVLSRRGESEWLLRDRDIVGIQCEGQDFV